MKWNVCVDVDVDFDVDGCRSVDVWTLFFSQCFEFEKEGIVNEYMVDLHIYLFMWYLFSSPRLSSLVFQFLSVLSLFSPRSFSLCSLLISLPSLIFRD